MTGATADHEDDEIRILHVDDEPGMMEVTAAGLTRQSDRFTVEMAATPGEARQHLAGHRVDCILADYDMPEETGIEFLEAVREEHPDLPFVLYTGKGSEEIASDAISAGVSDYLQKDAGEDHYTILANRITNLVAQARAERDVERTQEYFSRILDHASDYVIIVSETGTVQYVSPSVERVMGYTPEELTGSDAFETIHPEDLSLASEAFVDLLDDPDEGRTVEYRARHADGSWRWLEVRGRNLLDDDVIDGILVTVRDITARKGHERELETVKRRFEAVLENSTTPMFLKAEDGTYIFVNRAYRDLFGFDDGAVVGRTDADLHPSEVAAAVTRNDETVLERGEAVEAEERVLVDGEERVFLTTKVPIHDTGERADPDDPVGVFGVATDITERRRQARRMETLVSNLPGIVYRCRNAPDWPMEVVRGECEALTGYPAEALEDGDVVWGEDILHPDDQDRMWEAVQAAIDDRQPFEVTYRIVTRDGETRWMWERGRLTDSGPQDETVLEGFITDITDRKEREAELTRIERRYQAVFEDPNILVGLIGTDGSLLDINTTAMEYVDASPEEVAGTPFWETPWFDHSEPVQREVREWIERVGGGEYVDFEVDLVRPEGEPYTVEGVIRPVTDDDGEVVSLFISGRDTTERKSHERELEQTNELLSTLLNELPAGVLAETSDRRTATVNQRLLELFDVDRDPESVVGEDCVAFAEGIASMFADASGFVREIDAWIDRGEPVSRSSLALADGRVFERSYRPIEFPDGDGHLWLYWDVTDRHDREESLRRFREAVEQAGTAVFITDTDGVIQFVNEEFETLTGYPSEVAVGETPTILDAGTHDDTDHLEELWRTIRDGDVWEDTVVDQRRSGEQYTAVQTVAPITDDGTVTGFVGVQNEITDRLVEQQRLSVLNRMLRHNLRNELTVVMGKVESVMDRHPDEQTQTELATVIDRCRRLLRESTKAQEFQQLLDQDSHSHSPLDTVLDSVREAAAASPSVVLDVDCEPAGEVAVLDVVEVALVELVENALEHGDGTVRVTVERPAPTQVVVSISDDGPGLPEMEQRVLDGTVEEPLNHSQGFGLWMAYWLVQLAGGSITYDQRQGSGTTIRVQVPVTGDGG